jgi:iron complex transport system substrate-binding protein
MRTLIALMLAVASIAPARAAVTATDDAGHRVTLARVPQRIVSLAPGATEMLFAAGAGHRVIATVEFSDEPADARRIPRIGDSNAIDMERVVALRPDVIIVWTGGNNVAQIAQLERLGIPIYRQRVESLDSLAASLRRLGALTATRPAAERAAADLTSRLGALAQRYGRVEKPSVLLEVWNRPIYTVGGTHLMSDALRVCGARNVFGDLRDLGPAVDTEAVIARDPELIIAVAPPGAALDWLEDWKRFRTMRAVRSGRLIAFEDVRLSRLGPSAVDGTEALCKAIEATLAPRPHS